MFLAALRRAATQARRSSNSSSSSSSSRLRSSSSRVKVCGGVGIGVGSIARSGGVPSGSGGVPSGRANTVRSRSSSSKSGHNSTVSMAAIAGEKVVKSESEWKKELSAQEYNVIRGKGTERAFTGEYDKFFEQGGYFACRACKNPLYSAQSKFDSGCGWPAFDKCYKGAVATHVDNSYGMRRVEIVCARCDGHLGHVFTGEHKTATNERHCVNSVSVKFVKGESPAKAEEVVESKSGKAVM
jgi:peptide-methionine (R)-S-oxide reductase